MKDNTAPTTHVQEFIVVDRGNKGIMSNIQITDIMKKKGRVDFLEFGYLKYKSNNKTQVKLTL